MTIANRAVAELSPQQNGCVVALQPNNNNDVSITGAAVINLPGCVVASNSGVTVSGRLSAQSIVSETPPLVQGSGSANLTTPATTGAPPDPYASQVASISLPALASCVNATIPPAPALGGCYNGLTFPNSTNITLAAGVYFVAGSLTIQGNATVSGGSVTFVVFNSGSIAVQAGTAPNPIVTLSAPTSGHYQGLLFYMVATDTQQSDFSGCVGSCTLTGAIYVPGSDLKFTGSSASNSTCTVIVAHTVTLSGATTLNTSQCKALGVVEATTGSVVVQLE